MTEILKAMATSASILFPIVVLVVVASIVTVRRGEVSMGGAHGHGHGPAHAHAGVAVDGSGAAAVPAKKPATVVVENPGVLEILGIGTAIFVVAILILFLASVVAHM